MHTTVTQVFLAALAASGALASPTVKRQGGCSAPKQRRAWYAVRSVHHEARNP